MTEPSAPTSLPRNKVPLNLPVANIEQIKAEMGPPPWNQVLVGWERMVATLICQAPGQGNNGHHHPEPEWWVVVEGELEWRMDDGPPLRVAPGDFVYCAPHVFHKIDVVGDKPAIRLAIGQPDNPHIYRRFGEADPPSA
jgi:quercetin dioxygenase-like cupin family protein